MLKLGFLYFPSLRALAYMQILDELGLIPHTIIAMEAPIPHLSQVQKESDEFGYAQRYFDPNWDLDAWVRKYQIRWIQCNASNINDTAMIQILREQAPSWWIFSGGGIANSQILNLGHRLIHVHPGQIPQYRGSTTFYYSLLQNDGLCASVFEMVQELDSGNLLAEVHFEVNLQVCPQQVCFMDHILDPWIRAQALRIALLTQCVDAPSPQKMQKSSDRAYFIIHPFLRALSQQKIVKNFDPQKSMGITIKGIV